MVSQIFTTEKKDLLFGDMTIPQSLLIIPPSKQKVKRIAELEKIIVEIGPNPLPTEQRLLNSSLNQLRDMTYPQIDLAFLSLSNKVIYKSQEIKLPRFGVYHIDENSFSVNVSSPLSSSVMGNLVYSGIYASFAGLFGAAIGSNLGHPIFGGIMGALPIGLGIFSLFAKIDNSYQTSFFTGERTLPSQIRAPLAKTLEFSDYALPRDNERFIYHEAKKLPPDIRKKYQSTEEIRITNRAEFIIPQKTKRKINESLHYFNRQNLFFISEVKPEDWQETRVLGTDPLLIGLSEGRSFLIDKFDPTPIEDYIAREFTS